jgi:hypothetical protein
VNVSLGLNFVQRSALMLRSLSRPLENTERARHANHRRMSSSDVCIEN